jgi:bacillithiol system protein YtxJ
MIELTTEEALPDLWAAPQAVIFKHSTYCDLSAMAHSQVLAAIRRKPDLRVHWVEVVDSRPVSQAIERHTGIRHESPQVLILKNGEVTWHASHRRITADAILAA